MNRAAASALAGSIMALAALGAVPAGATTVANSLGFGNPGTVIDFGGLLDNTPIDATYAAQGIRFGGLYATGFFGNTLPGTTAPAAANFSGGVTNSTFTISFEVPVADAVFYLLTDGYGTTITSLLAGAPVETVTAGQFLSNGADYFGFTGSNFDQISVNVSVTGTAVIDNLQISDRPLYVPEPGSSSILIAGLAGLMMIGGKRRV